MPIHPPNHEPYNNHWPQVHPDAFVHRTAVLIGQVQIGLGASIWPHTTLRGDDGAILIGANTSVQDGTVIHATEDLSRNRVGDRVTIGHNCTIHGATIGHDCIIGMGTILLDNCQIGAGSLIGAGALITQRTTIPPGSLVLGSPAKVVRPITDQERDWIDYSWRRYQTQAQKYRQLSAAQPPAVG